MEEFSSLGQNNVPFTGRDYSKSMPSDVYCEYLSNKKKVDTAGNGFVSIYDIQKFLSRRYNTNKSISAIRKALYRLPCVEKTNDPKIYYHDEIQHYLGQIERGVVEKNVPKNLFDLDLEYEIHAEMLASTKGEVVCDKNIVFEDSYPSTWCNFHIAIKNGRVWIQMRSKNGDKYGLNLKRYVEYRDHVHGTLVHLLKFVPKLRVLRFDFNQDDHRYRFDGPESVVEAIATKVYLREYSVKRKDKAPYPIKRSELSILNEEYVPYVPVFQDVLTRGKESILTMDAVKDLMNFTVKSGKMYNSGIKDVHHYLNKVVKETSKTVNTLENGYQEIGYQVLMNRKEVATLGQSIDTRLSTFGGSIDSVDGKIQQIEETFVDGIRELVDQGDMAIRQRNIQSQLLDENNQLLQENNQLQITRIQQNQEIIEKLEDLKKKFDTWRKVATWDKLEILATLKKHHKMSLRKIAKMLQGYYKVSHQALSKFIKNNGGTFFEYGTKSGNFVRSGNSQSGNGDNGKQSLFDVATLGQNIGNFKRSILREEKIIAAAKIFPGISKTKLARESGGATQITMWIIEDLIKNNKLHRVKDPNHITRWRYYFRGGLTN